LSERQPAPAGVRAGPLWPALVKITLYVSVGAAAFAVTFTVLLTSAVISRAAAQCVYWWRAAGHRRRLIGGMVISWPLAQLASSAGVLPAGEAGTLIVGAVLVAYFGAWLALDRWRGRRRWRQRGPQVVDGGGEAGPKLAELVAAVERLSWAVQVDHARLDLAEQKIKDLLALMAQQADGVLPGWPDHAATEPFPKLRLLPQESPEHAGSA